jgi:hypothetical protein
MDQCKPSIFPMQQNVKLSCDDGSKEVNVTVYRHMVASLTYLTTTKPDISYFVSLLSQFMVKPHEIHWNAAKAVLRYLKGTLDYGIKYTDASDVKLIGYSDSDWAGNLDDRKSTTGYAFNIGSRVVSWSSKKHPTISLSSTEEKYKALCTTTCEVVWLRRLLQDVGEERKEPTMMRCDNQSSINIAKNPIFHARTRHVEAQYHFVKEKLQSNEITLMYCNTSENVADIFTKPLGKIKFELFREMLGVEVNPFSIKGETSK